ncbi:hypothetical protein F1880_008290 [Penicillium rolfsii]|nr:hypothetical protein F1880_008290 [Penicillium rolfsii]
MRIPALLLPVILVGVQAQTAMQQYDATCPRSKACVLAGSGPLLEQFNAVFMERIEESEDENPFDPEDCDAELAECRENAQSLNTQLDTCRNQQGTDTASIGCNKNNGQNVRWTMIYVKGINYSRVPQSVKFNEGTFSDHRLFVVHGLLLPLLLAGAQAQTAQEQYDAICPQKHFTVEEILPGYTVKYSCYFRKAGEIRQNIESPRDCARLCREEPGCVGSSWSWTRKVCALEGTGNLIKQTNAVFMEEFVPQNPVENDSPFEERCEDQVAECKNELEEWEKGNKGPFKNAFKPSVCAQDDGQLRFLIDRWGNAQSWRIACGYAVEGAPHSTPHAETFGDCVKMCQDHSGTGSNACYAIDWSPNDERCNMKVGSSPPQLSNNANYYSAYMWGWVQSN